MSEGAESLREAGEPQGDLGKDIPGVSSSLKRTTELRAATNRAAMVMEARRLMRESLKDVPKATAQKLPFWERESTEQALRELDVWASVHWARTQKIFKCPTFAAIFEHHRNVVDVYRDFDTGVRDAHPLPTDPEGLEEMVQTAKPPQKSAEWVLYLSVNGALASDGLIIYSRVLLHYLPRSGAYQAAAAINPGGMKHADQDIIRQAVWAVLGSWKVR